MTRYGGETASRVQVASGTHAQRQEEYVMRRSAWLLQSSKDLRILARQRLRETKQVSRIVKATLFCKAFLLSGFLLQTKMVVDEYSAF